ncbi:MAG: LysR family transcriptional regulator [Oscillospiraceae bacterium]
MAISLEQLEIFLAVAEYRSFSRAAESLYISHSTTSRNVAALEEILGVQLLTRDNRTVRLTPAGDVLYHEGTKLMRRVENVKDMVRSAGLGFGRSLSIVTAQLQPAGLYESFSEFCRSHPEVRVGMLRREPGEIWKLIDSGEADLGMTMGGSLPENLGNIDQLSVSREGLCLLVDSENPLAACREVSLQRLSGLELVCDSSTSRFITPDLRAENSVSLMPSVDSVLLRVSTGGGVAIVPRQLDKTYMPNCKAIPILSEVSEEAVLIWRKSSQNPSLMSLLRLIRRKLT